MNIEQEIREFLSVPKQYDLIKTCALNIMRKSLLDGDEKFASDLDDVMRIVCTLHILHGLPMDEIEFNAKYTREMDMPEDIK